MDLVVLFFPALLILTLLLITQTKEEVLPNTTEVWPSGTYGLPKAISGCPEGESGAWSEGWLKQDMENDGPQKSAFSQNFHIEATLTDDYIKRYFCIKKTTGRENRVLWPKGSYCVYRKYKCPKGMKSGSIIWDDEDKRNKNSKYGVLPSGRYNHLFTIIYYCCQNQGLWYKSIVLPTYKPFYLLPLHFPHCQRVKWALSSLEYIIYNTEDNHNVDNFLKYHPFTNAKKSLPKIYYCYYYGCRHKITGNEGSFKALKNNTQYPDHQYCSWLITVDERLVVSLEFKYLHVPNCQDNYIDFYDGMNKTFPFLKRLCGSNATKDSKILSTGNILYMVVKSGDNSGQAEKLGLKAKYKARLNPKSCRYNTSVDMNSSKSIQNTYVNFPDFKRCSWLVTTNHSFVVSLEFTYFNLPKCEDSCIKIFDSLNVTVTPLAKLCGANATNGTKLISTGNNLLVVFESTDHVKKDQEGTLGFHIQCQALVRPTGIPKKHGNRSITSKPSNQAASTLPVISIVLPVLATILIVILILLTIVYKRRKQANDGDLTVETLGYVLRLKMPSQRSTEQAPRQGKKEHCKETMRNPIYESGPMPRTLSVAALSTVDNNIYEPTDEQIGYMNYGNPLYSWPEKYGLSSPTYTEPTKAHEERHYEVLENPNENEIKRKQESDEYYATVDEILK